MESMNNFKFSQVNLQDYVDCKRRFYYRHIQNLSWPAIETEPALEREQRMLQGGFFHKLVQRYYSGLPEELLSRQVKEEPVFTWWNNFLASLPAIGAKKLFPEQILNVNFHKFQMIAKYDLIVLNEDGSVVIYDWKTSYYKPSREYLAARLQTRVYPFILSIVMNKLIEGENPKPEKIEMVYWYANSPDSNENFIYSVAKMKSDGDYLLDLINEIVSLEKMDDFPLTPDVDRCKFCVYRSLCDRGDTAGEIKFFAVEFDDSEDLDFDFTHIEEIEF